MVLYDADRVRCDFCKRGSVVFRHELLDNWREVVGDAADVEAKPPRFKLRPLLEAAMTHGVLTGSLYRGRWTDVGTPERLVQLDNELGG